MHNKIHSLGPWRWAALALLAGGLSACAGVGGGGGGGAPTLEGSRWVLAELAAQPGQDLPPTLRPTLAFENGRAGGSDGCNRYARPYTQRGGNLDFGPGPGVGTLMACQPGREALSQGWQAALAATRAARVAPGDGGMLELLDGDGRTLARLAPQPAGLAGTRWEVLMLNNGQQAVSSLIDGSRIELAFDADGRLSGSGGCNPLLGRYELKPGDGGQVLRLSGLAQGRRACLHPTGVMTQEAQLLRQLEGAERFRREGDRLELRRADGALVLSAKLIR